MKKKRTLDINYAPEYCMLGISSPLPDYKLVLNINNKLHFSFKKIDDLLYNSDENKEKGSFSLYYFEKRNLDIDYFILSNRATQFDKVSYLIPEYKQFDYLFLLKCCDSVVQSYRTEIQKISVKIKEIENVLTVFTLDLSKIKHINHFFSDLELRE